MANTTIEIVTYIDENYSAPLAALLRSIGETLADGYVAIVYVLHDSVPFSLTSKVQESIQDLQNVSVQFFKVDTAIFAHFPTSKHITISSYFRLQFDTLLPLNSPRTIVLDSDLIVNESLHLLHEYDLKGKTLGAVINVGRCFWGMNDRGLLNCRETPPSTLYYNAGVLVIDREKWSQKRVFDKASVLANQFVDQYLFHDQCLLNKIFVDDWIQLPLCWNQQTALFGIFNTWRFLPCDADEVKSARQQPRIIHFTTDSKPWDPVSLRPFTDTYRRYAKATKFLPLWSTLGGPGYWWQAINHLVRLSKSSWRRNKMYKEFYSCSNGLLPR